MNSTAREGVSIYRVTRLAIGLLTCGKIIALDLSSHSSMKISSSKNIFDLFYLDILENSMENILSLNCGEECRSLTCFLQQFLSITHLNMSQFSVHLRLYAPERLGSGGVRNL